MPVVPTKLFDVRQGNNSVDADGTVYPRAILIVFKDNASKDAIVDTIANGRGYQATIPDPANPSQTIPNPKSRQQAFNDFLQQTIKDAYRSYKEAAAVKAAGDTAKASADAELP